MKKLIGICLLVPAILLAGCDIEINTSKEEALGEKGELLGSEFERVKSEIDDINKKKELTSEDQELIAENLEDLNNAIKSFEEEEGTFITKGAMKLAKKVLDDKKDEFSEIQEKAKNGTATVDDVKELQEILEADVQFSLFGK